MMDNHLKLAIKAAVVAGSHIMEIYEGEDFELEIKDDNSPLTKADKVANTIINDFLNTTPIPIISEENKQLNYNTRKDWESCWVVDPLDGTKEFIKRNGEFTVNIALVHKGKSIFGVIYAPTTRELYYAMVSQGKAYKVLINENHDYPPNLFHNSFSIKPKKRTVSTVKIIGSRSHMNDDTKRFMKQLEGQYASIEIVPKGSSLKFCLMAEGKADIYPRFAPTMEWDTAAGHAICNAVGLKVVNAKDTTNSELIYNKPNLLNDHFIVR